MKHTTIAVDLAKTIFEIAVSDRPGHVSRSLRLSRSCFLRFFAEHGPATVVLKACGTAHYWGRHLRKLGHQVVLLPPYDVRPYVRRNKTDRADAKGLLEAYRNEAIHPVPVKEVSYQGDAALHRLRSTWLATRTSRINTLRGILREIGFTIPVAPITSCRGSRAWRMRRIRTSPRRYGPSCWKRVARYGPANSV